MTLSEHDRMVELLRKVDIFSQLREYELDIIARRSRMLRIKKGDVIFSQGAPAEALYVVEEGRIGIISVENDHDAAVAHIAARESFGELEFLGRTERSASAMADIDSVVLKFPSGMESPDEIFREHSYISANMLYRLLGIITERIWNVNRMIQERTPWLQDLRKQLFSDRMTGLYNQVYLKEDFVGLLPDLGESAALLMIKPDNFKEINDRFGHETGDNVLNIMAIFLQSELREYDIGVRYRGDEYAAILVNTGRDEAVRRAKEIGRSFGAMDLSGITGESDVKIKVSIGIALYPADAADSGPLVEAAHAKMMHARNSGGNRINI